MKVRKTCIIFSKNRPLQLQTLLVSMKEFKYLDWFDVKVLYKYDKDYQSNLNKVKIRFPEVEFINQVVFQTQLIKLISEDKNSQIMFSVDDGVFIHPYFGDDRKLGFSSYSQTLRMGWINSDIKPKFSDLYSTWYIPNGTTADEAYAFSVDCHIYAKSDILNLINQIDFKNPNEFEDRMVKINSKLNIIKYCMAPPYQSYVNYPLNVVQDYFYKDGWISEVELNDLMTQGYELIYLNQFNDSPHMNINSIVLKRGNEIKLINSNERTYISNKS